MRVTDVRTILVTAQPDRCFDELYRRTLCWGKTGLAARLRRRHPFRPGFVEYA